MTFHGSTRGAIAQINMTPMIDLLLVLLIIFLVIAPVHPKGLPAALPQPALSMRDIKPEPEVVLSIEGDGSIRLDTRAINRAELGATLAQLYGKRADRTIFVQGAGGLLFGQVAEVIDVARTAGVERIALITAPSTNHA